MSQDIFIEGNELLVMDGEHVRIKIYNIVYPYNLKKKPCLDFRYNVNFYLIFAL